MLLILALIGGDYYMLMNGPEIATAKARRVQETAAKQYREQLREARKATRATESQREQIQAERVDSIAAHRVSEVSLSVKSSLLLKGAAFYAKVGTGLRVLLLLNALGLVFLQKAPEEKPGEKKREPIQPKTLQLTAALCAGVFLLAAYVVLSIQDYGPSFIHYGYPIAVATAISCGGLVGFLWASTKRKTFGLTSERKRVEKPNAIYFPTKDGGWITIANPFQGTLVLGGAGAGKTYSIGEPMINQFAEMNFAGLVYDFKFPVLAEAMQKAIILAERKKEDKQKATLAADLLAKLPGKKTPAEPEKKEEKPVQLHIINFYDLTRSERVNPLRAADMPVVAYAEEYSRAIINNLNPSSIQKMEFFDSSAVAYLTSIIWFFKKHHPEFCTLPHVVATAINDDFKRVLSMLDTDLECGDKARSIISAVKLRAEKQVAAVVGTLQNILAGINSPEIVWVLTPDEKNGEGFSLNLNDKKAPKLLCIGNSPTLQSTFSPVVSCIITVCIKLMNQQGKHRSYVFLDEAATIYVPGLETLPNTGRSNQIATVYMTQDLAQMTDAYGKEKMNVMIASLGNQLFGKVNSLETAKHISEMVGREDRQMTSESQGQTAGGSGSTNSSSNKSTSYQERFVVRPQDTITLKLGEFIGQTVGTESTFFQGIIDRADATDEQFPLHPMADFGGSGEEAARRLHQVVQENFIKVRQDVQKVLAIYTNTLAGGSQ